MSLAIELVAETSPEKIHKIALQAGKESTANKVVFCIAAWKIMKLEPWKHKPFRVEDEEITSFTGWRMYMSAKVQGEISPASIDNAAQRIEFLVNEGVSWAQIVNALAFYPQAIEDLRQGPETKTNIKQLMGELDALPGPREARLRVMEEQGRSWAVVKEIKDLGDKYSITCQELLGTTPVAEFMVHIVDFDQLTASQQEWVKNKFKIVKSRE